MPHAHASGFPSPCVWRVDRITYVGQDRLNLWHICQTILTCSGSGDPELQRGPMPAGRRHQDQEVSPIGKALIYETPSLNLRKT